MNPKPRNRKSASRLLLILLGVVVIGGIGALIHFRSATGNGEGGGATPGKGGNRAQPVSVAEVKTGDLPIWINAIGTAVPRNQVTVRSRIDGELMQLHFREGDSVKQGQLLAEIDPRPYQVQLMQANGQLAKDAALLRNAELDLDRYRQLLAQDSIAKQQVDTQEALVRQYQGTVEVDRGAVESAKLQLTYARIIAPVGGRIGLRQVDPGNQVHASDTNGLAVITQLQPMTVVFSAPEANLPAINTQLAGKTPVVVEAWDREQKTRLARGRLLTTDNLVDTATGTIKMKAEFANDDEMLFPNQFINVRMLLGTSRNVSIVPSAAIQRGAKGTFVYAVDDDNQVKSVPVKTGTSYDDSTAIEGDVTAGAKVVIDGADKLRDAAKVEVIAADARKAAGERGEKGAKGGSRNGEPPGRKAAGGSAPAGN